MAKKLMTVAKSKYYMLKVNYPQLAWAIDNEPLIDESEGTAEVTTQADVRIKNLEE